MINLQRGGDSVGIVVGGAWLEPRRPGFEWSSDLKEIKIEPK